MANVVSSCLKCTSEKLYYDGSVVLSKTTTAKSNHKSTVYTPGDASVNIPSYTYSWNNSGTLPTNIFGSSYTGSAVNNNYVTHYYYKADRTTVGSNSSKYQTRKPTYTPPATWSNGTESYKYGPYNLTYGSTGEIELIISHSKVLTATATRTWGNYSFSTTTAAASAAGTKAGYTFYRWACQNSPYNSGLNTDAELILQEKPASAPNYTYAAEASWTSTSSSLGTTYKFYPMWVANQYTITYNANGGTGTMAAQTVTYNNSITLNANTFTRTGYTFSGWVSDTNASHPDKETFTYQRAANTIMYAQWTPITYSIKYNANNGTGTMSNTSATYDVDVTLSDNAFTRTGYSFSGWGTSAGATSATYANKATVRNLANTQGAVANLYAVWVPAVYTITLNKNSGTGGTNTIYEKYNTGWYSNSTASTSISSITAPTRTGYQFKGYYNSTSGTTQYIPSGGSLSNLSNTTFTSNSTIYAQWTANSYSVSFNSNGGTGTMNNQSFTYGVAQNLTACAFTKSGYAFKGWNTSSDGTGTSYNDGQSVSNLTTTNGGTVVLYAQWALTSKVNIGGTWKTVKSIKVKIDENWKTVVSVKVKIGGNWQNFTGWGS